MSLLLLLGDGITPDPDSTDAAVQVLLETEPGQWADISGRARSGSVKRGRQRELDTYDAGQASVTVTNSDRHFDPNYADGPYHGNLKPMRGLQVRANYAGITYPRFAGYLDRIRQRYLGPHTSEADLIATDGFKVLAKAELPRSVYRAEVAADAPARWYRMDEPSGSSTVFDSSGNRHDGTVVANGATFGESGMVTRDPGSAMSVVGTDTSGQGFVVDDINQAAPTIGTGPFSIEFWIKCGPQNLTLSSAYLLTWFDSGSSLTDYIEISVRDTDGSSPGLIDFRTGLIPFAFSGVRVDDNAAHHVVCVRDTAGNLTVYVDGVAGTPASGTVRNITSAPIYVGNRLVNQQSLTGTLQHLAIYTQALSAERIAAHNTAGRTPWGGDLSGQRINRVLDLIGWPAGLRDIDTGQTTLQSADIDGATALDHSQKVTDSEFGALYMTADGWVRVEGRGSLVNQPTTATFGDGPGEVGYTEVVPDYGDDLIRNDVTISRNDGTAQNAQDAASIDEFQIQSYTRDGLLHDDDDLSRDAADFLVSEYAQPIQRFTSLRVMPRDDPTVRFPAVLARELTDRVTVIRRPQGIGAPIEQISVIEGAEDTWAAKSYEVTFAVSPAYAGSFLELDSGDGRLATAGAELAGALDAVTLVFDVTLTGGDLFTTDAGDFPFDVTVGDETMTVTAISGAASPQSFTVTRANPVAHDAGDAVQVADPVRIYF